MRVAAVQIAAECGTTRNPGATSLDVLGGMGRGARWIEAGGNHVSFGVPCMSLPRGGSSPPPKGTRKFARRGRKERQGGAQTAAIVSALSRRLPRAERRGLRGAVDRLARRIVDWQTLMADEPETRRASRGCGTALAAIALKKILGTETSGGSPLTQLHAFRYTSARCGSLPSGRAPSRIVAPDDGGGGWRTGRLSQRTEDPSR
jgi:hypothetical protein